MPNTIPIIKQNFLKFHIICTIITFVGLIAFQSKSLAIKALLFNTSVLSLKFAEAFATEDEFNTNWFQAMQIALCVTCYIYCAALIFQGARSAWMNSTNSYF